MIDEFQDTNAAQLKLADLITNHPATNNRPNIMVVGDDDQAIFTFQGAEISNVTQFINNYDAVEVVVLKENYRSTNRVLDSAQEIILLSSSRLVDQVEGLSKELTANTPNIDSEILRLTYPTVEHQCSDVAQRIAQLWNNGQKHIAVLARKHSSLEAIASSLQQQQVPLRYERKNNILDQEAIEQILLIANAATAIASGDQKNLNVYLSRLLRHPMWKIPASTLWKLAIDNYSKPDWLSSVVEHSDPRLNELADWLSNMARRTNSMPLPRVIDNIIGLSSDYSYTSPVREHFLVGQENTHEYMNMLSGLSVLRHVTREFAGHKATLEDFVRFVDLNKQTKKPVTNSSWYQSSSDAVDLLTVHGAKGLEFDTVFVIDTIDDHWRPRKSSRAAPSNFVMQPYGENPDDYVRLLYVAATRAKKKLYFTNPEADDTGKQLLSSPLVPELETIAEPSTPLDSVEVLEDKLRWPRLSETSEKNLLANSLDTFSLSASSLLDFLDVTEAGPQSFKERWLLRIPREQSTAGSFGNAIHGALQTAQRLINESGFSINPVLDRFESELDRQFLPEHELARLTSKGEALLRSVLANPEALLPVGAKAELKLETTLPLGANIKGSIDQLLVTANEVIVADYKTGRPLSSLTTQNKQQAHKAWKHKTQLLFYALLVSKQRQFRGKTITTKLVYLENDGKKPKVIEYSPTKDELNVLEELIETIWPLIRNFDLPDTESYAKTLEGVLLFEKDLLEGKYHGKKHKQ